VEYTEEAPHFFLIASRFFAAYFLLRPLAPKGFAIGSVRALPCAAGGSMCGARALPISFSPRHGLVGYLHFAAKTHRFPIFD